MLLRNALSLTPCLALFMMACNDTTSHQQAQAPTTPSPAVAQNDQSTPAPVTPADSATPPVTALKASPSILRHHGAYAHHHVVRHAAAPAEIASAAEPAAAVPAPATVTVPSGTVLTVLLTQELGSKTNHAGDAFTATVAEAVMVDGKPLIPQGSVVSGKVTEATPMELLHNKGVLQLTLDSINLNGQEQMIQTSTASEVEKGKTDSVGDSVASASAVAAPAAGVVGAPAMGGVAAPAAGMVGAGKGAAFAGGGLKSEAEAKAGTVVAALTGNKDLVFPAQASMQFTLQQALEVKP